MTDKELIQALRDTETQSKRALLDEAADRIERMQWTPVAKRLPEDRSNVLVVAYWHERWGVYMGWCAPEREEWNVHIGIGDRDDVAVTHWMPLPEAPGVR